MSAIGAYTVFSVRGIPPMAGTLTDTFERPGVPGYDVHNIGWGGQSKTLTFIALYASNASRVTARLNFNALKGRVITVTDDKGNDWANLLVENIEQVREWDAAVSAPANEQYGLEMEITLKPLALTYP